jgi:hypothetical protein
MGRRSNLLQRGCIILGSYHVISATATACVEHTALKSPERGIVKGCGWLGPNQATSFSLALSASSPLPNLAPDLTKGTIRYPLGLHQLPSAAPDSLLIIVTPPSGSRSLRGVRPVPHHRLRVTVKSVACLNTLFRQPFSGDRRRGRSPWAHRPLLSPLIVRARGHRCG